jgi:hypothetical protein
MASDSLNIYQLIEELQRGANALDKMMMFTDVKKLSQTDTFVRIVQEQVKSAKKLAGILGIEIEKE